MVTHVIKRDGTITNFDSNRIYNAIKAADMSREKSELNETSLRYLTDTVCARLEDVDEVSVEAIQDIVETVLMSKGYLDIAKAYILYRNKRTEVRDTHSRLMGVLGDIYNQSRENSDVKRENANINTDAPMGVMLKVGSEASKDYALKYSMKPEHAEAHKNGDIHIHDLDFFNLTATCVQIPLGKLLKNGFTTGHGFLRSPKSINSAAALTCIALQSSQNDMHGGQAIPCFDYDLAPYVAKSYVSEVVKCVEDLFEDFESETVIAKLDSLKNKLNHYLGDTGLIMNNEGKGYVTECVKEVVPEITERQLNRLFAKVERNVDRQTYQAMEALVHNLNTMASRAGSQVPFSSVNLGTATSTEGRLVTKNLLLAIDSGLGKHETSFFPVTIFKMKTGVNYNEDDPNYDLFKLAMKVSAKRLFPCFSNLDAPFNYQYYKEGHPETEVAYMGCVDKDEVVTCKIENRIYLMHFDTFYNVFNICKERNITVYLRDTLRSNTQNWVPVLNCIRNNAAVSSKIGWYEISFNDGTKIRCTSDHPFPIYDSFANDGDFFFRPASVLKVGDCLFKAENYNTRQELISELYKLNDIDAYAFGLLCIRGIVTSKTDFGTNSVIRVTMQVRKKAKLDLVTLNNKSVFKFELIESTNRGNFYTVEFNLKKLSEHYPFLSENDMTEIYNMCAIKCNRNKIPQFIFNTSISNRYAFIKALYDVSGELVRYPVTYLRFRYTGARDKHKLVGMINNLGFKTIRTMHKEYEYVEMEFNHELANVLGVEVKTPIADLTKGKYKTIAKIKRLVGNSEESYDVTTASGTFDFSGVCSHNCRTRVMGNVYDPDNEIAVGRGNLSFTTLNLPRIGIEANHDIDKFYELLDSKINLVFDQLYARYLVQAQKRVINFPFLMGQGEWIGSENLGLYDKVGEIFKNGTLSMGYIGLAECLTALFGKHHGEDEETWKQGYAIIKHMREMCDKRAEESGMNYSLLMTPAEGLSGRFVRMDREKYGIIPGVTDKDYYTNSSHIPVSFKITAAKKIELEAPFHALANGGHIAYVEVDGDPLQNLKAFEQIVKYMHDLGIGYGAINHAVDMDPVCGYIGIIGDECPRCHRREGEPMTREMYDRIKGYISKSSNMAYLGDMSENLQELSDYKQ